ncbi:MAG: hypothetical protein LBT38_02235 [Deltaproteobacteria bacterium]|jgi:hypothetical protein|nr:hypothetical protein [Deltaproteobacteria bacterium]
MSLFGLWGWTLTRLALKSRNANRQSLDVLGDFFERVVEPAKILGHFGLGAGDLAFLDDLALKLDGWYPLKAVSPIDRTDLTRLIQKGFLLARPFPRLIRLSDAGRFLLILCVR